MTTDPRTSLPASPRSRRTRRSVSSYAVLLMALLVLGGGYAALAPSSTAAPSESPEMSLAIEEGRQLYLRGCSSCHGLNAEGGSAAPSLIGSGEAAVVYQVGTGRMPLATIGAQADRKPVAYSQSEIDQLAAYVGSLAPGPRVPPGDLTDGDLQEGGELFRNNCASCHSSAGAGGALSYGKYAPALAPATPDQIYAAMQTGPESMPVFSDNVLTPEEKRSVVRYVQFITESEDPGGNGIGRIGPVSEGLVIWLLGIGGLVGVTLWIGARA